MIGNLLGNILGDVAGDLAKDAKGMADELRHGTRTRTITVAKAYCTPARNIITGALQPYGVRIYGYREYARFTSPRAWLRAQGITGDEPQAQQLPMATFADVTVSERAAAWAEYLLLRTGKLYVPGQYVNRRNQTWAERHGGKMPPQWDKGEPMIEASCGAGRDAWQGVRDAMKKAREKKK